MAGRLERSERSWPNLNDEDYRGDREHRGERAWDRAFEDARYGEYPSGRPVSYGRDEHYGRGSQEDRRQPRDHGYDPERYRERSRDFYDAGSRGGSSDFSEHHGAPYGRQSPYGRDQADSWSGWREPGPDRREHDRSRWNDRFDDDRRWQQSRGRFSDEPRRDWNMHGREIGDFGDRRDNRNAVSDRDRYDDRHRYDDRQRYGAREQSDDRGRRDDDRRPRDERGQAGHRGSSGPTWRDFESWSDDRIGDARHSGLGYSRGDDYHDRFWSTGDRWRDRW